MGCTSSTTVSANRVQEPTKKCNAKDKSYENEQYKDKLNFGNESGKIDGTGLSENGVKQKEWSQEHKLPLENKKAKKTGPIKEDYTIIDNHARKAPSSLKTSPQKLVEYLMQPSTEPSMVIRAIFVWITENIRYDVDGYYGVAPSAPIDAKGVLKCGKSVCAGYANVMELLCREANIPVQLISGYAKGYGYSAEEQLTTDETTNHAWNAIQLGDKWYLVDCTWGAGSGNKSKGFQKKFDEFYFLTDPSHFIMNHFPYMENDMEESLKWQLLEQPITLEEFSRNIVLEAPAFELAITPVSHKQAFVMVDTEDEFEIRNDGEYEIDIMADLNHRRDDVYYKQPQGVFCQREGKTFKMKVHPNKVGTYILNIYGKQLEKKGSYNFMFKYMIKCTQAKNGDYEFPHTYSLEDQCELIKPKQYRLKANTNIEFHITSPFLKQIMVNQTYLTKSDTSFTGTIKTGGKDKNVNVFGSRDLDFDSLKALFKFKVE